MEINIENEIRQAILSCGTIAETDFKIINNSQKHSSHAAAKSTEFTKGQTHFLIQIDRNKVQGNTSLAKNRAIYSILSDVMPKFHSLEIKFYNS